MTDHAQKITKPVNQTPVRWKVLGAIRNGPLTVSQVARRMGVDRQGVQRVANALIMEGLVQVAENPDHRRSPKLSLTAKGRTVLERITKRQVKWVNELARHLSMKEIVGAVKTLQHFQKVLVGVRPSVFQD